MWIKSFRIQNYKSFHDSGEIQLAPGFNIFVGRNNSGKTALLEALGLQSKGNPHLSSQLPKDAPPKLSSRIEVTFAVRSDEARRILLAAGSFNFPIAPDWRQDGQALLQVLNRWLGDGSINVSAIFTANREQKSRFFDAPYPSHSLFAHGLFDGRAVKPAYCVFSPNANRTEFDFHSVGAGQNDDMALIFWKRIRERIFCFRAERMNIGEHQFGAQNILLPNASNLPEVLNSLQGINRARFTRINKFVSEIFPDIRWISCRPKGDLVEIIVWNTATDDEREDLAVPLFQSGTGLSQVLAILYVLITSDQPQTIIIDEPNSFLHPGAVRKLMRIMQERAEVVPHQYIFSTHSPEVIGAVEIGTLNVVYWENEESRVDAQDRTSATGLRRVLHEVGARLSDVFGADRIVWVEGPTEQECFPKILRANNVPIPLGTSFVALISTGGIEGKRPSARLIREIYQRLSNITALMPATLAFSLDREGRTEDELRELNEHGDGLFKFLPRRCYENYLLRPSAIADVLNELPAFRDTNTSPEDVETWLKANAGNDKYKASTRWRNDLTGRDWLEAVNGPLLLLDLFATLSECKEEYRKMRDSVRLTEVLLERDPEHLTELVDYLRDLLGEEAAG